ncbi:MAG: putative quinol monooxygenase [Thermoplasmata archaeon]
MFLRFARFRFKEGKEGEGLRVLQKHLEAIRNAPGCIDAWLGQGQHPATECVVVALFPDEDSLRHLEGRLRSDPSRGGDFFALLALTTQPPEIVPYEIRRTTD